MHIVRESCFEEYVHWYLARESRKCEQAMPIGCAAPDVLLSQMRCLHPDKLRPWFNRGRWTIVSLDAAEDAMRLVCVDSWETRHNRLVHDSGANNRLARRIVTAARDAGHFDGLNKASCNSAQLAYRDRIESFRRSPPKLCDGERLVICSLNEDEAQQNPQGTYYLHDGFGRLLAYLYLVAYEGRAYSAIEAFLAESPTD